MTAKERIARSITRVLSMTVVALLGLGCAFLLYAGYYGLTHKEEGAGLCSLLFGIGLLAFLIDMVAIDIAHKERMRRLYGRHWED
jgi:hypothetical protein